MRQPMSERDAALTLQQSSGLRLSRGEIHVWAANTTHMTPLPESLSDLLSEEEVGRSERYHFAVDRDRFRIGRALLRHALGMYTGKDPRRLAFRSGPHGKPSLVADTPIRFNVSHSGDAVLLAFGLAQEIGVDVERIRATGSIEPIAHHCFSRAEREAIFRDRSRASECFFEYWAAKEAWIKADGRGMSIELRDYTLRLASDGVSYRVHRTDGGAPLGWIIRPLPVLQGYACAVAATAATTALRLFAVEAAPTVKLRSVDIEPRRPSPFQRTDVEWCPPLLFR
jgi:4'-phosphopantetheinyl transferase